MVEFLFLMLKLGSKSGSSFTKSNHTSVSIRQHSTCLQRYKVSTELQQKVSQTQVLRLETKTELVVVVFVVVHVRSLSTGKIIPGLYFTTYKNKSVFLLFEKKRNFS